MGSSFVVVVDVVLDVVVVLGYAPESATAPASLPRCKTRMSQSSQSADGRQRVTALGCKARTTLVSRRARLWDWVRCTAFNLQAVLYSLFLVLLLLLLCLCLCGCLLGLC